MSKRDHYSGVKFFNHYGLKDEDSPADFLRNEYIKLSVKIGSGPDYWESLTLTRLYSWISSWNKYQRQRKK